MKKVFINPNRVTDYTNLLSNNEFTYWNKKRVYKTNDKGAKALLFAIKSGKPWVEIIIYT